MGKHAYLIMAHNEFGLLEKLISLLDDSRNDIFLHIDKKVDIREVPKYKVTKATLKYVKQMKVSWGGDSQIKCELNLLKEAVKTSHDYYHLISGVDLPLKSQDYIHAFFESHHGKNFMEIDKNAIRSNKFIERIQYYRFFQNVIGRNSGRTIYFVEKAEEMSLNIQRFLKINRTNKSEYKFYKGENWFSITHDLATEILKKENFIKKFCFRTICADEVFLQTVSMNSKYSGTIEDVSLRYIDWTRGTPYTFTIEDLELLVGSDKLFARKFSERKDSQIIEKLYKHLKRVDKNEEIWDC